MVYSQTNYATRPIYVHPLSRCSTDSRHQRSGLSGVERFLDEGKTLELQSPLLSAEAQSITESTTRQLQD